MNTTSRSRACTIALFAVAALASTVASAQVGRYSEDDIRAHQEQLARKAREDKAKCPPSETVEAGVSCSKYARAIQPPQPSVPAHPGKQATVAADGVMFPNVTRESPKLQATKAGGKALQEIVALYQAKDYPQAIAKADVLIQASDNAYERSFAAQLAGTAAGDAGDASRAATYFKQAIDANGLDNNDHYAAMYNLAVTQYKSNQYAAALASLDRLVAETKSDTPGYQALKASLLTKLDRPAEAAALYEQLHGRDPSNKTALMNAVALYQQAQDFDKANALLAEAKAKGQLTEPGEYRALYAGYINAGKLQEAVGIIDEGLAKGIVKPSADLAQAYAVIAQTAYASGNTTMAVDMFRRAAAISTNGEASLNLAKVLMNEGRIADARAAAKEALAKGVKTPGDANRILGAGPK